MFVKKLIVLAYTNKTLYYILLKNFWGIGKVGGEMPPSPPHPSAPDYGKLLFDPTGLNLITYPFF